MSTEVSIIEQQRIAPNANELVLYSFHSLTSTLDRIIHRMMVRFRSW